MFLRLFKKLKIHNMKQKIFDILDELEISYANYEHAPVFTCNEAKGVDIP